MRCVLSEGILADQWEPGDATIYINEIAKDLFFDLIYTTHAKERMEERGITTGDVIHVLKNGFVHTDGEKASRGRYKYKIVGRTPNSPRSIALIVIATRKQKKIKIITVMWPDGQ